MGPIHVAMMNALLLRRKCPKCSRTTVVAPAKARATVKCNYCGAELPPARKR